MKKFILGFFLCLFSLQMASAVYLMLAPVAAGAIDFIPNVPIPGIGNTNGITRETGIQNVSGSGLAIYISAFYVYSLGALGIFATTMIMWGGLKWIVAGGNSSDISAAKSIITNAVFGLCLGLLSYVILYTVNPALVSLQPPVLKPIVRQGEYCEDYSQKDWRITDVSSKDGATAKTAGKCGDQGKVWKIESNNKFTDTGKSCAFRGNECKADEGQRCAADKDKNWACRPCTMSASILVDKLGLPKVDASCQLWNRQDNDSSTEKGYCYLTHEWDVGSAEDMCIWIPFECMLMREEGCGAYDKVQVEAIRGTAIAPLLGIKDLDNLPSELKKICEADPCKIAETQGKGLGRCVKESSFMGLKDDCTFKSFR